MNTKNSKLGRAAAILSATALVLVLGASVSGAKERSKVKAHFDNTGVDLDASGRVEAVFKASKAKFKIKLKHLDPNSVYTFLVDGVPEADFTTNDEGNGKIGFKTNALAAARILDFDPRTSVLAISDGSQTVLSMDLLNESGSLSMSMKEETNLEVMSLDPDSSIRARHRIQRDGRERFEVKAKHFPSGSYTLYVNGVARGTMTPSGSKGKAKIKFDSVPNLSKNRLPLDFDPRNASIELVLEGVEVAGGQMQAAINDVSACDAVRIKVDLTPQPGTAAEAGAEVKWRVGTDCRRRFTVKLENMPDGAYDLYVDGELRGTHVDDEEYELDFRSRPDRDSDDDDDHLPLHFDPSTALIEIRDGETVLFSDTLASATPLNTDGECIEGEIETHLFNLVVESDGRAKVEVEHEQDCSESFELKLQDMAAGSYDLTVGAVPHGTILVLADGDDLEGEIEFSTDPDEGEMLLDFNPRGQTIVISQDGVDLFSRTFPE